MAADNSLKGLTTKVSQIADNSRVIQKDVRDIRDAVCGDGILGVIININKKIDDALGGKKGLANILSSQNKGSLKTNYNKQIYKSANSIEKILQKILAHVEKMDGGRGKLKDAKDRKVEGNQY